MNVIMIHISIYKIIQIIFFSIIIACLIYSYINRKKHISILGSTPNNNLMNTLFDEKTPQPSKKKSDINTISNDMLNQIINQTGINSYLCPDLPISEDQIMMRKMIDLTQDQNNLPSDEYPELNKKCNQYID